MDAFIIIFLLIAAVIFFVAVFRYIGKKNIKEMASKKYYNHENRLFDYQNNPTDSRSIISPLNPVGPNWVGEDNLFRDRHNRIADSEKPSSERK